MTTALSGISTESAMPTSTIRLSLTTTTPFSMTWGAPVVSSGMSAIVMTRPPVKATRPRGMSRGNCASILRSCAS